MGATKKKKPVHLRLRPEEQAHLDVVVDSVASTRSELIRESIYLLIRLWKGLSQTSCYRGTSTSV